MSFVCVQRIAKVRFGAFIFFLLRMEQSFEFEASDCLSILTFFFGGLLISRIPGLK